MYDSFLELETEEEYRTHFINKYCNRKITLANGLVVSFYRESFEHAFFEKTNWKSNVKDKFSIERARRIDWIEKCLQDKRLTVYCGWDSKKRREDSDSRVTLIIPDGYVVVIRLTKPTKAKFVTAYVINKEKVIDKIKSHKVIYQGQTD